MQCGFRKFSLVSSVSDFIDTGVVLVLLVEVGYERCFRVKSQWNIVLLQYILYPFLI